MKYLWIILMVVTFRVHVGQAEKLNTTEIEALLREGNQFFREANLAMQTNKTYAIENYKKAILRYERIANHAGIKNGKLYYNIGNGYFRMNDLGRAILYYRRALRYIPSDPNLLQNLEYARSRRMDKITEKQQVRLFKTIFFWHYEFSMKTKFFVFAVSFAMIWIFAIIRLFRKYSGTLWVICCCVFVAGIFFISLGIEWFYNARVEDGVIIQKQAVARKGDGESYEPAFKEPLHAGTEFNVIEKRQDWLYIELMDSRRCWIPTASAGLVKSG